MFTSLTRKHFHLDSGPDIVLTTINDPCNGGNDEDDTKGSDTVV
jgi:hypothetical protein